MGSCSQLCRALCVSVCSDSKNMGLTRETSEVWCGTSVARLHRVPSTLFLPWPPCDVASLRTKHPATVVSMKNQTALVIPLLSFSLFWTTNSPANAWAVFAWLYVRKYHKHTHCQISSFSFGAKCHSYQCHLFNDPTCHVVRLAVALVSCLFLYTQFQNAKKLCFQVLQTRVVSKICKTSHACRLGYTQLTKSAP